MFRCGTWSALEPIGHVPVGTPAWLVVIAEVECGDERGSPTLGESVRRYVGGAVPMARLVDLDVDRLGKGVDEAANGPRVTDDLEVDATGTVGHR